MRGANITEIDLTGAQLRRVRLGGTRMRMLDVSGAVLRDVDLSGASIDGAEINELSVNGVEVAPLIEQELVRRQPARALRRSSDPADLREAWRQIDEAWSRTLLADVTPQQLAAEVEGPPWMEGKPVSWSITGSRSATW